MTLKQKIAQKRAERQDRSEKGTFKKKHDPFLLWGEYPHGWSMIKDAILCVMLINALIGQLKQVNIASLLASKTITIIAETRIQPVEASTATPEPKAPQNAKTGEFTAYNSEVGQTDADPEIMASNKKVYAGAIACPIKYSFGTKIKVAGKTYTCEDRMAEKYRDGEYFDIWMESGVAADNWGRQTLEYEIIK